MARERSRASGICSPKPELGTTKTVSLAEAGAAAYRRRADETAGTYVGIFDDFLADIGEALAGRNGAFVRAAGDYNKALVAADAVWVATVLPAWVTYEGELGDHGVTWVDTTSSAWQTAENAISGADLTYTTAAVPVGTQLTVDLNQNYSDWVNSVALADETYWNDLADHAVTWTEAATSAEETFANSTITFATTYVHTATGLDVLLAAAVGEAATNWAGTVAGQLTGTTYTPPASTVTWPQAQSNGGGSSSSPGSSGPGGGNSGGTNGVAYGEQGATPPNQPQTGQPTEYPGLPSNDEINLLLDPSGFYRQTLPRLIAEAEAREQLLQNEIASYALPGGPPAELVDELTRVQASLASLRSQLEARNQYLAEFCVRELERLQRDYENRTGPQLHSHQFSYRQAVHEVSSATFEFSWTFLSAYATQVGTPRAPRVVRYRAGNPLATFPTRGIGGRVLSAAEQAEFNAFSQRATDLGWIENPNRTGSWGRFRNGVYEELGRIDVAELGMPGWRGRTHIHITGEQGHLPPSTPLPGEL